MSAQSLWGVSRFVIFDPDTNRYLADWLTAGQPAWITNPSHARVFTDFVAARDYSQTLPNKHALRVSTLLRGGGL